MPITRREANSEPEYSEVLDGLFQRYRNKRQAVRVNFRKLVKFHSGIDRYTHLIHPYPAKLLLNIPYFFLRCRQTALPGATVLDPFCGSGTVLLEAQLSGQHAIGADANPLARLITLAKTTPISPQHLESETAKLKRRIPHRPRSSSYDVINIDHWFTPNAIDGLSRVRDALSVVSDRKLRTFFDACFSATTRKVSLADPRLSVPVRLSTRRSKEYKAGTEALRQRKRLTSDDVVAQFLTIAEQNTARMATLFENRRTLGHRGRIAHDARKLPATQKDSDIGLVITSPPYTGAQKYVRSSSLSLGWLDLIPSGGLRTLERQNIGREHYSKSEYAKQRKAPVEAASRVLERIAEVNPLRAHIACNYLWEMKEAMSETYRVLQPGGHLALVAGANIVCGFTFDTPHLLEQICRDCGFDTVLKLSDDIRSRGLMTKRNRTAGLIASEVVLLLQKPE